MVERPDSPNVPILAQAVINGDAYRASKRQSLSNGSELIIHINPTSSGGTMYLGPPRTNPPGSFDYDVWENADPGTSTNNTLNVHNMRYDGDETPVGTVTAVDSGGLDTTNADKTEETLGDSAGSGIATEDVGQRGIYRIIPTTDTISLVITNTSGASQEFGFDLVVYEGETLPN